MRGVMTFDDYNYSCFNPYILKEEPGQEEKRRLAREEKRKKEVGVDYASKLSEANLNNLVNEDYTHDDLGCSEGDEEKKAEYAAKLAKEKAAAEAIPPSPTKKGPSASVKSGNSIYSSDVTESKEAKQESDEKKSEEEELVDEDLIDDNFLVKVYYSNEEIQSNLDMQRKDAFKKLLDIRTEILPTAE